MPTRRLRPLAVVVLALGALTLAAANAQTPERKEIAASASVSGIYQADGDLDGGGKAGWSGLLVNGGWSVQTTPQLKLGFTLQYDYQDWRFSNPAAFGGAAPWSKLNLLNLGIALDYAYQPDLLIGVSPIVGWSYETGASSSDVLDYGAIVTVTKVFSPQFVLGAGVGVFRQVDETKVFPIVIIRWQIDDHWRLQNPFRAGPTGGAGVELAYAFDDRWEAGVGGAYRSYRFRLDDQGFAPGGVGENRFIPVFARVTRKIGEASRLDFYAGVSTSGRLSVDSSTGNSLARVDYNTAALLGLTFAHRF